MTTSAGDCTIGWSWAGMEVGRLPASPEVGVGRRTGRGWIGKVVCTRDVGNGATRMTGGAVQVKEVQWDAT